MKRRKSYVERQKEIIDKLSDEELLEYERSIYRSKGITVGFGIVIFVLCVIAIMVVVR